MEAPAHHLRQGRRAADRWAFFLAKQGQSGIGRASTTEAMFGHPTVMRTADYLPGRFG